MVRESSSEITKIQHYPHALYLHGVKGPNEPNVEQKIKEVKEKFGLVNSA